MDVFGGSGFCSYLARQIFPEDVEIIYNDYDYFVNRLALIENTNKIREEIFNICEGLKFENRIPDDKVKQIKDVLNKYKDDELDFITISTYILHSARRVNAKGVSRVRK